MGGPMLSSVGKRWAGMSPPVTNPQIWKVPAAQQGDLSRKQDPGVPERLLTLQQLSRFFQHFFQILPSQAQSSVKLCYCSEAQQQGEVRLFQTFCVCYHSVRSVNEAVRVLRLLAFPKAHALLSTVGLPLQTAVLKHQVGQGQPGDLKAEGSRKPECVSSTAVPVSGGCFPPRLQLC